MYKVLLVDDEALIREAISENIQWTEMGFHFMGACENGRQAMEAIEKASGKYGRFDEAVKKIDPRAE
mgnify:CR=1 FL=1